MCGPYYVNAYCCHPKTGGRNGLHHHHLPRSKHHAIAYVSDGLHHVHVHARRLHCRHQYSRPATQWEQSNWNREVTQQSQVSSLHLHLHLNQRRLLLVQRVYFQLRPLHPLHRDGLLLLLCRRHDRRALHCLLCY
jgi:hypothetical protein